jgi:hypothetical protein
VSWPFKNFKQALALPSSSAFRGTEIGFRRLGHKPQCARTRLLLYSRHSTANQGRSHGRALNQGPSAFKRPACILMAVGKGCYWAGKAGSGLRYKERTKQRPGETSHSRNAIHRAALQKQGSSAVSHKPRPAAPTRPVRRPARPARAASLRAVRAIPPWAGARDRFALYLFRGSRQRGGSLIGSEASTVLLGARWLHGGQRPASRS